MYFRLTYFLLLISSFGPITIAQPSAEINHIKQLDESELALYEDAKKAWTQKENFHQAIEKCEKLNRMYPDSAYRDEIEMIMGHCYACTGQTEKAKQVYRAFHQRSPELFDRYLEELRKAFAKQQKDTAKMAVTYQANTPNPKQENLEALYQAAEKAEKASDWSGALAKYQVLNAQYPNNVYSEAIAAGIIQCHVMRGECFQALYVIDRFINDYPNHPELEAIIKSRNEIARSISRLERLPGGIDNTKHIFLSSCIFMLFLYFLNFIV